MILRYFLVLPLLLVACSNSSKILPTYRGKLTYPITKVTLQSARLLVHKAKRPCSGISRPEVGSADAERTFSEWFLYEQSGSILGKAPSFLSDPKYNSDLKGYFKENDLVTVIESKSGNSVIIVEDRSPTFPRSSYLLLQRRSSMHWDNSEILFKSYLPQSAVSQQSLSFSGGLDRVYPEILELTDTHIRYSQRRGDKTMLIDDLPRRRNRL